VSGETLIIKKLTELIGKTFYINRNLSNLKTINRKMALRWHPDNFKYSKKAAEKKFIEVAAAKEVLTGPGMDYFLNILLS